MVMKEIEKFEEHLGFGVAKKDVTLESGESHDESLSYSACLRFYGKDDELKSAISDGNKILKKLIIENKKSGAYKKEVEAFYSLIGSMYYILGDFKYSIGYFMKCLSYNKQDVGNWMGLLFSLKSIGEFELFEKAMFGFEEVYGRWSEDNRNNMTQEKLLNLIENNTNKNAKIRTLGIVQVTRYCNQKCVFCSVPPFNEQPSFEELKERIKKIKEEGTTELMLSGGEPTIRKDLTNIIAYGKSLGFESITMQTNGVLIKNKEKIEELFSAGMSKIFVSFHSHIKQTYNELTGTKSDYEKVLETLKLLNVYEGRLGVNITINSLNYRHLTELLKFLLTNYPKIHSFSINFCDLLGDAADNPSIVPRFSDVEPYLNESMKILKKENKPFMVDFVPVCFMKGFEDHCTEYQMSKNKESENFFFFGNDNNVDGLQMGDTHPKIKVDMCEFCEYETDCKGINIRHVEKNKLLGEGEDYES